MLTLSLMVLLIQLASVANSQVLSIGGGVVFLLMGFNMAFFNLKMCVFIYWL